jgi:hypothetical protein
MVTARSTLEDMSLPEIAGIIAVFGLIVVRLAWLKARIVSSGELSQAWGMPDDEDAKAEIESIFPGATKPLGEGGERPDSNLFATGLVYEQRDPRWRASLGRQGLVQASIRQCHLERVRRTAPIGEEEYLDTTRRAR